MMKLLIDAGNTRLKWCWYDGEDLPLDFQSAEYEDLDEQGADLFKGSGPDTDDVLVCNVAGEDTEQTLIECFSDWDLQPVFFTSKAQGCGIRNAYVDPQRLGVDRWMAMIGAWSLKQEAACIVDCGTAVTIDVLDDQGLHLGGMIIPGMELMQDSLTNEDTGILSDVQTEHGDRPGLLARDTGDAIVAGTLYALVALIERVRQDIERELDIDLPLYLSGGDVDLIKPLLSCESHYEPMLIFQGMIAADEDTDY
jgi:type III pantothenate kinase